MKRHNHLYHLITDIDVIMQMYDRVIRINTKNKRKLERFENYYSENIISIKEELITNNYIPGHYNIFLVKEPKYRIVMSQEIRDKIVNHLIAKYFLLYCFDKTLIEENIATRIDKGTHYGLRLFKNYLNIMKRKHKRFYILKFDINKYFYNIDHEKAMELIERKIKDKEACEIIRRVINTTNEDYINKTIVKIKMDEIKRLEKLNICNLDEKIEEI